MGIRNIQNKYLVLLPSDLCLSDGVLISATNHFDASIDPPLKLHQQKLSTSSSPPDRPVDFNRSSTIDPSSTSSPTGAPSIAYAALDSPPSPVAANVATVVGAAVCLRRSPHSPPSLFPFGTFDHWPPTSPRRPLFGSPPSLVA